MERSFYESHVHMDPTCPIIFHNHSVSKTFVWNNVHWHEDLELLYCTEGEGIVTCDGIPTPFTVGKTAVVNSNALHRVDAVAQECRYYCLIIDKSFCDRFGLLKDEPVFQKIIDDSKMEEFFHAIYRELNEKKEYYKEAIQAALINLLIHMNRHYIIENNFTGVRHSAEGKLNLIKKTIIYIRKSFREPLTLEEICQEVGVSKYYLCHIFKEIVGSTLIDYINIVRCNEAKRLLNTGNCNVTEAANMIGFNNNSYFTKIYKRYMNSLPSNEVEKKSC